MAFVTIEDVSGSVECIFFSEPWANSERDLTSDQPVLVSGKLEIKSADAGPKILAESARLLATVREERTRRLHLVVEAEELAGERLPALLRLLQESPGPRPVRLHVHHPGAAWSTHDLPDLKVIPDETLMQGLETLFRRPDVPRLEC
jgi:DNA polymerase-3 subunit alpha